MLVSIKIYLSFSILPSTRYSAQVVKCRQIQIQSLHIFHSIRIPTVLRMKHKCFSRADWLSGLIGFPITFWVILFYFYYVFISFLRALFPLSEILSIQSSWLSSNVISPETVPEKLPLRPFLTFLLTSASLCFIFFVALIFTWKFLSLCLFTCLVPIFCC